VRRVCVYAGAARGVRPAYAAGAALLGETIARRGLGLVYGGASRGLMGVLADAALAAGGEVIGVLPRSLDQREIAHRGLTELRMVETLHERKAQMTALSAAFVALPGGIGTLDELFETATWNYLGIHDKPYGLYDVEGYFQPLLRALDHAVAEGFVAEATRARMLSAADPGALLDALGLKDGKAR
jgi:uncharacterized protein (TIGR00730 family)